MTITNNSLGRLSIGPSPTIVDGLVLYLDAASRRSYTGGTTWKDLSGNGNDFTIYGSPAYKGKYFTLDGSTSQYFQANPFPHPTDDFTIELYERISVFNLTPLYSYAVTGDDNEGLMYLPSEAEGVIHIYGPTGSANTSYELFTGRFYQIVRTRSYSSGDEKLYINGTEVFSGTLAAGTKTETGGSFNVGQEQDSPGGGFVPTQTLNGDVSMVRIYNRVLSTEEIVNNYQNIKSRFDTGV
jgi:hypothetical protein